MHSSLGDLRRQVRLLYSRPFADTARVDNERQSPMLTISTLLTVTFHSVLMGLTVGLLVGFSLGLLIGAWTAIDEGDISIFPGVLMVVTGMFGLIGVSIGILVGLLLF